MTNMLGTYGVDQIAMSRSFANRHNRGMHLIGKNGAYLPVMPAVIHV